MPINTVDEPGHGEEDRTVAAVTIPPAAPSKTGITDMETLLQGLLPGIPTRARPGPIRRYWATVVCFSCGKAGHGVGRCPELNETFPFMLPVY